MRPLLVREILQATKGVLVRGDTCQRVYRISIDSRTLISGDIFVALKGDNFDGHRFIGEAIYKGAAGIIVARDWPLATIENASLLPQLIIKAANTREALIAIAGMSRDRLLCPLIAVTGSAGKTTTKDIIAQVLGKKYRVGLTRGTQNNSVGVPLTLLGFNPSIEAAVIEIGMNKSGEIRQLADIVKPDVGIITNVGPAHLEFLGSIENIITAKAELLECIDKDGLVLLNRDDSNFPQLHKHVRSRLITVGTDYHADYQAVDVIMNNNGQVHFSILAKPYKKVLDVKLPVVGWHSIYPALFATAVAFGLGLTSDQIVKALAEISLPEMRSQLKDIAGIKVIDDCYNANPLSVANALNTLTTIECTGKRIAVCGDMLELGTAAKYYHQELGKQIYEQGINRLITIGDFSKFVFQTALAYGMAPECVRHCENNIEAVEVLGRWLEPGDIILIKGSRANRMEEIVKGIEEYYSALESLIV